MMAKTIMVQGTTSNAGKSVVATALCQIFAEQGLRVAPFKAWNMSRASYQTNCGLEIGVAQGLQAELLGIEVTGDLNPVFLKAKGSGQIEVYLQGKLSERAERQSLQSIAWPLIQDSFQQLRQEYDFIVLEGAGSPVELNIKERDLANMSVAKLANSPVLLVADIDRGGALAGIIGTIDLLPYDERNLVLGSVLNKFRGDPLILEPALNVIEDYTTLPVLGVLPYYPQHGLAVEDGERIPFQGEADFAGFVQQVRERVDLDYIFCKLDLEDKLGGRS